MHRTRLIRLLLLVVLAASAQGCGGAQPAASPGPAPTLTLSPGPGPAAAPARLAAPAPAGTVTLRPGPFDDRFTLSAPALTDGVVTSSLTVTSDVSEILVLAVTADFYDAGGALLGRVRYDHAPEHAHGEGVPDEAVPLRLEAAPGYQAAVSSAVVAVPVLVNE